MNQARITEDTKRILRGIREVNNMIAIPETRDNRMGEIKDKLNVILQTFKYIFLYKDELKNIPFFIKENLNLKKILGRINAIFITVKRIMPDIDIIKPQNKIQRYIAYLNAKPNVLNNAKPNVLNNAKPNVLNNAKPNVLNNAKPNVLNNAKPNVLNNAKPNGVNQTKKLKGSKNLLNNPFIKNGKPTVKRTRNNTTKLPYNTTPIRPLFKRTNRYINHSKTFKSNKVTNTLSNKVTNTLSNKVTNTLSNNRMKEFNLFLDPSSDYKPLYRKIETLSDDSKTFIEITTKLIRRLGKATRPYQVKTVVMLVAILITKLNRILNIKEDIDLESVDITKNIDKEQIEEWKSKVDGDNTLNDLRLILVDILTKITKPI